MDTSRQIQKVVDAEPAGRLWTFAAVVVAALTIALIVTCEIGIIPLIDWVI